MDWNSIVAGCYKDITDSTGKVIGKDVASLACLPAVFQNIVGALLLLSGIATVFLFIYAGLRYIMANADQKQIDEAHQTLLWALVGFVLILLSIFIINVISHVTGAECIVKFPGLGFGACQ